MRREGIFSWLLVGVALAAPGAAVYSWLTNTVEQTQSLEAPRRIKTELPLFDAAPPRQRLTNPTAGPVVRNRDEAVAETEVPQPPIPRQVETDAARPLSAPTGDAPVVDPPPAAAPPASVPARRTVYAPPRRLIHRTPIEDTIKLEAIIAFDGSPAAIVNGLAVKVGDMVGKVKVILITSERVTFAYKNLRFAKSI